MKERNNENVTNSRCVVFIYFIGSWNYLEPSQYWNDAADC